MGASPFFHRSRWSCPTAPFYVKKVATSSQSGKEGPLVAISYQVYLGLPGEARLEQPVGAQFVVVGHVSWVLVAACG